MKHPITYYLLAISFLFLASCSSGPANIPDTLTADKLIQLAQEASDKNKYDLALQYYTAVLDRYSSDSDSVCAADYEIAFIHYKERKYDTAKQELNDLLVRYTGQDAELLPGQYQILANIVLQKIAEKQVVKEKLKKAADTTREVLEG
jgi:outer membrane protein assembly factor BamD (BamD/ComL family)